ncbi:MAG TPA: hypothetical protein VJ836_07330 [Candidatus Saccharimonadales bacterium]|nr:hypothetical protein [Candidatus Saccharimonadales bacterium]
MQYLFSIVFALLLVLAQSCWKLSVDAHKGVFDGTITIAKAIGFVFSPLTIFGVVVYVVATVCYMFMLSKYQFSMIQATAIPLSLIFSVMVATIFFHDHLTLVNLCGIALIAAGLVLLSLR